MCERPSWVANTRSRELAKQIGIEIVVVNGSSVAHVWTNESIEEKASGRVRMRALD